VGGVEVEFVAAAPEERVAALHALDVVGVHAAAVQHAVRVVAEVVADRPHHAHVGEEAGGEREVNCGAAEHALALPERGLHRVERDRTDDDQAHAARNPSAGAHAVTAHG
jgi:hypothetical protein